MSVYVDTHPVFVSHTKEIELLLYFVSDLQHRLQVSGKDQGKKHPSDSLFLFRSLVIRKRI